MQATTLRARYVVPLDRPPIDGGLVTIAGERVVDVGTRPPGGSTLVDVGDVALLPGLINAHTHLEFSDLARPLGAPGMRFVDWIRLIIARRSQQALDPRQSVAAGMRESLRFGVTTLCDITTADLGVYPSLPQGPDVVGLLEVIGFSRPRATSALATVEDRLQQGKRKMGFQPVQHRMGLEAVQTDRQTSTVDRLQNSQAIVPRVVGLSPHAPYTVGPSLLHDLVGLAKRDGLAVAMHLGESREEIELLQEGNGPLRALLEERGMWDAEAVPRGTRPLAYLQQLAEAPRALIIHGTYLDEHEVALLAKHRERMTLVHCPRTHAYFNGDRFPLAKTVQRGVRVVLGTDSRASSPDLSLLAEVRHAANVHREISPSQLLQLVTLDAAEALGIQDRVGSITPGKLANLTAIPIEASGRNSPVEAIVRGEEQPVATWYRGANDQ